MSAAVGTLPLPPSYSDPIIGIDGDADVFNVAASAFELPAYTPSRTSNPRAAREPGIKEFPHELKKKGKSFAVMTIIAEESYSRQIPTFLEGMPVKGRVRLTLDKPDGIQSVVVSVTGQVIVGANQGEQLTFIDISQTLWSHFDGEPQNTNSDDGNSSPEGTDVPTGSPPKFTGKLQGDYTWQFSIDLPKEVVLPSGPRNQPHVFNPPQTFNERHTRASINYEVSVRFTRGKLRTDHRIPAQIGYIPMTRPPPFPYLRRLAYQQGTPLLGPTMDPDGWFSTEPVQVRGSIFNDRTVEVGCTLFIANPLSYTRGSLIPFCLRLESDDEQALDLISTPKAVVLRLRRRIKYHWNAEKSFESLAWKDAVDHSQLAVWWPSIEGSQANGPKHVRFLNGELHLRPDIKPTSAMAHFRLMYSVVLFPFDSPGFISKETEPLIEHPVDIVTCYAPGPRPRMFAPPGYESDSAIVAAPNTFTLNMEFF
ncbi:hypothetical protein GALMADRAFT_244680 [Galerina marginata CBS 339.88]|uniref:Arrestin-like N-terminal domain-containing protein n=1 Tax=Galerina marginata (strain CBS 339.88) TaxID=685588 RepID=A0A067T793_GALM3|nr:hypothetical protein GALMADRAFT_244680 [Galerina marginata CBS 339.88]